MLEYVTDEVRNDLLLEMASVLKYKGYQVSFVSYDLNEPCHVHVKKSRGKSNAKYWMTPEVRYDSGFGFSEEELSEILILLRDQSDTIIRVWNKVSRQSVPLPTNHDPSLLKRSDKNRVAYYRIALQAIEETTGVSARQLIESRLETTETPSIEKLTFDKRYIYIHLDTNKIVRSSLENFHTLYFATPGERSNYQLSRGINTDSLVYVHWPDLDEDIELRTLIGNRRLFYSRDYIKSWLAWRGDDTSRVDELEYDK